MIETLKVSQVGYYSYQLRAAKMMNQPTVLEFLNEGHSIDVDTSEHRPKMATATRQRLRPWLQGQLNRGEIDGVEWIDKKNMIFKLPWKHGGKSDWNPVDSELFKAWAKNTGRYREGQDKEEYATWKTRVRCALNKANDIKELKDKHGIDDPKPYKVYQFLPKKDGKRSDALTIGLTDEETSQFTSGYAASIFDDDSYQMGGDVPVVINNFTAKPVFNQPFMNNNGRQPMENPDYMGVSLGRDEESNMSGIDEARWPSDLDPQEFNSGDLVHNNHSITEYQRSLNQNDYQIFDEMMEVEIPPVPNPMPSYDQIVTDPKSFPTDPKTGEPEFNCPPTNYSQQQQHVMVDTIRGPIQVPGKAQIKVIDARGTTLNCPANELGKFMLHLQPPINIIEVTSTPSGPQVPTSQPMSSPFLIPLPPQEPQEEPQKESVKLDHAYGVHHPVPLMNLDTVILKGFEMRVTLYYFGKVLFERDLIHPQGYCFHFGCDSRIPANMKNQHFGDALMGPENMHRCPLPEIPPGYSAPQKQNIQTVLDGLERGFTVHCHESNIYLTRYCKTRVFVSTTEARECDQALPRQMTHEAFRYQRYTFKLNNESFTKPDPTVYVGLAQKWNFGKRNDGLAVTMKIVCSKALQMFNRTLRIDEGLLISRGDMSTGGPIEVSRSNEIDKLARQLKEQNIRSPQS